MYKPVLSEAERDELVSIISQHAADDVLLDVAEQVLQAKQRLRTSMSALMRAQGLNPIAVRHGKPQPSVAERIATGKMIPEPPAQSETNAQRQEPPGTAAKRVTEETKRRIFQMLSNNTRMEISTINQRLNGRLGNTSSVLKRLWSLQLVEWDGKYYHKPTKE